MSETNHNLAECEVCEWRKINEGCRVFVDRTDVITDEDNICNALIVRPKELKRVKKEIADYSGRAIQ